MDAVPALEIIPARLQHGSFVATRYPVPFLVLVVFIKDTFLPLLDIPNQKKNLAVQAPAACRPADRPPPIIAARTDQSTARAEVDITTWH
jgi:hypothetical protein